MEPNQREKVVVAMSGGVDSSVAAALLIEKGYNVTGMMLRLWNEPGEEAFNRCCTPESMALARRVANRLNIPFYVLDVRQKFREVIVNYFLEGYESGITPNPCMMCNRHIRFGVLLDHAKALGAKYLATGHYARLRQTPQKIELLRGVDPVKDQSYVLSVLNQEQLSQALFPIGEYPKSRIREIASNLHLPVATRADSQDLCFLGGDDYRNFLNRNSASLGQPGPILNKNGDVLGVHNGLAFYTIGQRKGIGISHHSPLYVIEKNIKTNTLIVGTGDELGNDALIAHNVNWIQGHPPDKSITATIKIRYQSKELEGIVTPLPNNQMKVNFYQPVRDITPGQAAVIYTNDVCIANGTIIKALKGS